MYLTMFDTRHRQLRLLSFGDAALFAALKSGVQMISVRLCNKEISFGPHSTDPIVKNDRLRIFRVFMRNPSHTKEIKYLQTSLNISLCPLSLLCPLRHRRRRRKRLNLDSIFKLAHTASYDGSGKVKADLRCDDNYM